MKFFPQCVYNGVEPIIKQNAVCCTVIRRCFSMPEFYVSLSSIEDVRQFVNAATRCPCEVDVLSGRYVVDGKSIMGLFSLDLSQPVKVEVRGAEEEREAFFRSLAPFAAEPPRQA